MKKKRELKRYFKNLTTQNELKKIKWLKTDDPNSWIQNVHIHFDQLGYGTNSFKKRKPHLDKLFRHFKYLAVELHSFPADVQLSAILLDKSSSSDALFVHRPNPNNNQFPFKIEDLFKDSTLTNQELQSYLNALSEYDKLYGIVNEAFCLVAKEGVGEPL